MEMYSPDGILSSPGRSMSMSPDINGNTQIHHRGLEDTADGRRRRTHIDVNNKKRWLFTDSQIRNSPSFMAGMSSIEEASNRRRTAQFIQDLGVRLKYKPLCMGVANTIAHRFFMFHSYKRFPQYDVAIAVVYLGAKLEDEACHLDVIISHGYYLLHPERPRLKPDAAELKEKAGEIIEFEMVVLQTLGFDLVAETPQPWIVIGLADIKANREVSRMAYSLCNSSLIRTNMCLRFKATTIGTACILTACRITGFRIEDNPNWWMSVDNDVTLEELNFMVAELIHSCLPVCSEQ